MGTATAPTRGSDEEQPGAPEEGMCGLLGQMDDERIKLMGLFVRTHRRLTDTLGRELEQSVGIPLVFFDVLIHVGGAPEGRLTMSRLSTDVALTTGGVTRLVDRMVEAGLVARQNCPNDRRSVHVVLTPRGQDVLGRAVEAHIEGIQRHVVDHLDDSDRRALETALAKVLDGGC